MNKNSFKKYLTYLITPLIIVIVMLLIYYLKDIYPFGNKSIICADLGQNYLPWYYNVFNILNLDKSSIFSFNLGLGTYFYYGISTNGLLSPLTWLIALIERNNILEFMNIFLIIKMCLMSISCHIFFTKIFPKANTFWTSSFSLLYAMSGYVLTNYHNIIWLDILILFPFLVLSIIHLFKTGKALSYIILLTYTIILSYYLSYMIIISIIFIGSSYIYFFVKKENQKKIMTKSILSTITSLGLSSIFLLPSITWITKTYRYLYLVEGTNYNDIPTKISTYFLMGLPVLVLIIYFSSYKNSKDKAKFKFWLSSLLIVSVGLLIEPINKMWHGGSYVCFPYRYGFIPIFLMLCASMQYLNDYQDVLKKIKLNLKQIIKIISIIILLVISIVTLIKLSPLILASELSMGISNKYIYLFLLILASIFLFTLVLITFFFENKIKYIFYSITIILQVFTFGYLYIGQDYNNIKNISVEHTDILQKNALETKNNFSIKDANSYDRYKDTTASFDENYAYIMDVPTISNWTHLITYSQLKTHTNLGYSYRYTKLQDVGGTLFSDAFYHIKYVFSKSNLTPNIYNLLKEKDDLKLYETKTLPFGILTNSTKIKSNKTDNTFDYQNKLYQSLFNESDDIINQIDTDKELCLSENKKYYSLDYYLDEESTLYLTTTASGNVIDKIKVNDETIYLPVIDNSNNTKYQIYGYSGIVNLGTYTGNVNIKLYNLSVINKDNIKIGYIKTNKYNDFIDSNSNYKISPIIEKNNLKLIVDNENNYKYIVLPLYYYDGIEVYLNDKRVESTSYLDTFLSVPLAKNKNNIVIKFYPQYFKLSAVISVLTLILLIVTMRLNKRYKLEDNKKIQNIFSKIFIGCVIISYIVIYVYAFFK